MGSWRNATGSGRTVDLTRSGLLDPEATARVADLRRDAPVSRALQPFVERYWSVRWDRTGLPPFRPEVLTHPSVNVSVETGTHPRFGVDLPAVLVHGPIGRRFTVDLAGMGRVSAVKFRPGGYAAFTGGRPPSNSVVPLGPHLGVLPEALLGAVLEHEDDDDRAAVLDAVLTPLAPAPPGPYLDLLFLLDRMQQDRELVRVDHVAALGAMSVRSLQRLFAAFVGLTPKAVLAQYRLQDAAAAIDAGEVDDLAGLATSLGWFDQAHFSRDFRAVVGLPPSAYLRRARQAP